MDHNIKIQYRSFRKIEELEESDQALIVKTKDFLERSYSPYSHFKVAAGILLDDGKEYYGANQENSAFPSCLCAEQVALSSIIQEFPARKIKKMIICTGSIEGSAVAPCGNCRQVLLEYEIRQKQDIKLVLVGMSSIIVIDSVRSILPFSFSSIHFC